jgi:uroporphyrinogen-III synthase
MKTPTTAYSLETHPAAGPLQVAPSNGNGHQGTLAETTQQFVNRVSAGLSASELLKEISEYIAREIDCEYCGIYLREGDDLALRGANNGHANSVGPVNLKKVEAATGWTAEQSQPIAVVEAAFADSRIAPLNAFGQNFQSSCLVPIMRAGRLLGVIHAQGREAREYKNDEIDLLAILGSLLASEIERSRLESENLQLSEQMQARKLIERAKGILQRDLHLTEEDAYLTLQRESRQRRKPMKEVASAIILSEELKRSR